MSDDPPEPGLDLTVADPWGELTRLTPARIALGRVGASLPTAPSLAFTLAHARARDAVHLPLDQGAATATIAAAGFASLEVSSAAGSRQAYLARPDLGRRLSERSRAELIGWRSRQGAEEPIDLVLVVGDGLSSAAIHAQLGPVLTALRPVLVREGWSVAPVVLATQARVALGDEIGEIMGARSVAVLIGERPGLSAPDSLGVYLTYGPQVGRSDGERNCISNIHGGGLSPEAATFKLVWLLREALRRRVTGVALKDESDLAVLASASQSPSIDGSGAAR